MGYLSIAVLLLANAFIASAMVYSYCDLTQPPNDNDPDIVFESMAASNPRFAYPREAIRRAMDNDRAAAAFVQAKAQARAQAQARKSQSPARNAARASSAKYMAPEVYEPLCITQEDRVIGKFLTGPNITDAFCFIVNEQVVAGKVCAGREGDMSNLFPMYQKYYCAPDSYYYENAVVFCDHDEVPRFETFRIPSQCTCKKYHCNLNGMLQP